MDLLVARLENVVHSEETYYATFHLCVTDAEPGIPSRIASFVRFSIDWDERFVAQKPAHHSEFDQFKELMGPGKWRVTWSSQSVAISQAPLFTDGNQVGWW